MPFSQRGCPVPFYSDVWTDVVDSFGAPMAPTKEGVLTIASNATLVEVSHDGETVMLLVCRPLTRRNDLVTGHVGSLLNDEPTMIFVPMMLRPLVLPWCHANVSCYFGVSRI